LKKAHTSMSLKQCLRRMADSFRCNHHHRSDKSILSKNRVDGNILAGILVEFSSGGFIADNTAGSNAYGIFIHSESFNNSLMRNAMDNNSYAGVGIAGGSSYNSLNNNTMMGNMYGILLFPSAVNNSVVSNTACASTDYDVLQKNGSVNNGRGNICDNAENWNDEGMMGCQNTCGGVCSLPGNFPDCGVITLHEVISYITEWAAGRAELGAVIDLINAWAAGG